MEDGPFKSAFDSDTAGVIRREIITYRMRNGIMIKETADRTYFANGDYNDSMCSHPLVEIK
jgi:hypothetical protein